MLATNCRASPGKILLRLSLNLLAITVSLLYSSVHVIQVTFSSEDAALDALKNRGCRLFGIWCKMDGGPPSQSYTFFDYPFEDNDKGAITEFFEHYGQVRSIIVINTYLCRVWHKGQPIICNLCGAQGHKSCECLDRDKCRLCKEPGHKARDCKNPWGTTRLGTGPQNAERVASVPTGAQPTSDPPPS